MREACLGNKNTIQKEKKKKKVLHKDSQTLNELNDFVLDEATLRSCSYYFVSSSFSIDSIISLLASKTINAY